MTKSESKKKKWVKPFFYDQTALKMVQDKHGYTSTKYVRNSINGLQTGNAARQLKEEYELIVSELEQKRKEIKQNL